MKNTDSQKQKWPVHLDKYGIWYTGGIGPDKDDVFYTEVSAKDRDEALELGMAQVMYFEAGQPF